MKHKYIEIEKQKELIQLIEQDWDKYINNPENPKTIKEDYIANTYFITKSQYYRFKDTENPQRMGLEIYNPAFKAYVMKYGLPSPKKEVKTMSEYVEQRAFFKTAKVSKKTYINYCNENNLFIPDAVYDSEKEYFEAEMCVILMDYTKYNPIEPEPYEYMLNAYFGLHNIGDPISIVGVPIFNVNGELQGQWGSDLNSEIEKLFDYMEENLITWQTIFEQYEADLDL